MGNALTAGLVAAAFIVIAMILFVLGRMKDRKFDIPAIISAIAAVVAVVISILGMPDAPPPITPVLTPPTPTPTTGRTITRIPTSSPTSKSTDTSTAMPIPTPTGECDASAHFQLGWDLINRGTQNCEDALESMSQAILCNPDNAEMWYGRGSVNFRCGAYVDAVRDLTEAIQRNDRNSLYYEVRALAYMRLGDQDSLESCVQDFIRVLKLSPDNRIALANKPLCQTAISPFFDDFSVGTIDSSKWDTGRAQHVSVKDGHLQFDTPVNETAPWVAYEVGAKVEGVSRIMFTVKLDTPPGDDLGWLVLGTSCSSSPGWMGASAGGPEGKFVIQYAPEGGDEGDKVYFEPVADGRSHTIDLRWGGDGVQVYIDAQLQDEIIPCEGSAQYANFGVGLNLNTKVSGYFDDIAIWP